MIRLVIADDHTIMREGLKQLLSAAGDFEVVAEARDGHDNYLSIELRRGRDTNSIVITDTGDGIPPEILNYVFIPFVSAQRPGVGTGLGLSFCRMIIEGAGGTISCRSRVNAGTSFTIELPVVQPVVESAAAA